jgi:hypothetical protein
MRRTRSRAVGLAAAIPTALLGTGIEAAAGGEARGTLGVTVQVVAPCGASLAPSGSVALDGSCQASAAPTAVTTEAVAPASVGRAASLGGPNPQVETEPSAGGGVRHVTLHY